MCWMTRRLVLVAVVGSLAASQAPGCTVPVFRYALERWPADAHLMSVASNVNAAVEDINDSHNANLWVRRADRNQTTDVAVIHAAENVVWYEGPWQPGLPTRLVDSPLRRRIVHELVTGTTAVFVLIESDNPATNDVVAAMLKERLAAVTEEVALPEQPDYEDETDGWMGAARGQSLSELPLQIKFTTHRVSRNTRDEEFFLRQITGLDSVLASPATPLVAVVFGQGRMITLMGRELVPEIIDEICWFLCSACSCRVKALNPGVDLLMAANWDEAVYAYPEPVRVLLPDGNHFMMGGTGAVDVIDAAVQPEAAAAPAPVAAEGEKTESGVGALWVWGGLAIAVVAGLAGLVASRRRMMLWIVCAAGLACCAGCGDRRAGSEMDGALPELLLYCGAGIRPAATALMEAFEREHAVRVSATYAGSGRLLGQLASSKRGDLFMPGSAFYVDSAIEQGLADGDTRRTAAYFVPTLFVEKGNPHRVAALNDLAVKQLRVGLGDMRMVAVGKRSVELFEKNGIAADAVARNTVYSSGTVNELCVAIELKNIDVAIVWDANARQFAEVGDAVAIPPGQNIVSEVPIVRLRFSQHAGAARDFIEFVASGEGQAIMAGEGYTVTAPENWKE